MADVEMSFESERHEKRRKVVDEAYGARVGAIQISRVDARLLANQKAKDFSMVVCIDSNVRGKTTFSKAGRLAMHGFAPPYSLSAGSTLVVKVLETKYRLTSKVIEVPLTVRTVSDQLHAAAARTLHDSVLYEDRDIRVSAILSLTPLQELLDEACISADGLQNPLDSLGKGSRLLKLMLDFGVAASEPSAEAKAVFAGLSAFYNLLKAHKNFDDKLRDLIDEMAYSIHLFLRMSDSATLSEFKTPLEKLQPMIHDTVNFLSEYRATSVSSRFLRLSVTSMTETELQALVRRFRIFRDQFDRGVAVQSGVILSSYRTEEERNQVLDWISRIDVHPRQIQVLRSRAADTGSWFFNHEHFLSWMHSDVGGLLWCPGPPGAGKTVRSATVIEHLVRMLATQANIAVAWIYCDYNAGDSLQTAQQIFTCILRQVVEHGDIPDCVASLYAFHKKMRFKNEPSLADWQKLWPSVLRTYSQVFLIIDALDECPELERRSLLRILRECAPTHVMMTGRDYVSQDVREARFPRCFTVPVDAQKHDLQAYCRYRVPNFQLSKELDKNADLRDHVIDTVTEKSAGLFIVARFHLDALSEETTLKSLRRAIEDLTPSLSDIYETVVRRINCQSPKASERGRRILSFVTHLRQPLTVPEMQHLLAYHGDSTIPADDESIESLEIMLSACVGTIIRDEATDTIKFVHYTAQEYFSTLPLLSGGKEDLAWLCVNYLIDASRLDVHLSQRRLEPLSTEFRFLQYTAQNWGYHARSSEDRVLLDLVRFLTDQQALDFYVRCIRAGRRYNRCPGYTGLHAAAEFGLGTRAQQLPRQDSDPSALDSSGERPLSYALDNGHKSIVSILLENGVDVNARGGYHTGHSTPLQVASAHGHSATVSILLEHAADVNAQGGFYGTAVNVASVQGHDAVVSLLLNHGADVNAQGGDYGSALIVASENGHKAVVSILLEHGADVNAQGRKYNNALVAASRYGHDAIVSLLLEHGADVNVQDEYYGNALMAALFYDHDVIASLLLERGADVNAQGGHCGTALIAASANGHKAIVSLLLGHGADVNTQAGFYGTALIAASARGREDVVSLLLEHGADMKAQGTHYSTALIAASINGNEAVVSVLLEHGADVNAQDKHDGTALIAASARSHDAVVSLLLEHGADVDVQNNQHGTALQAASAFDEMWNPVPEDMISERRKRCVMLLLDHGAYVNARGGKYGSALQAAEKTGDDDIIALLKEKGAIAETSDAIEDTPGDDSNTPEEVQLEEQD